MLMVCLKTEKYSFVLFCFLKNTCLACLFCFYCCDICSTKRFILQWRRRDAWPCQRTDTMAPLWLNILGPVLAGDPHMHMQQSIWNGRLHIPFRMKSKVMGNVAAYQLFLCSENIVQLSWQASLSSHIVYAVWKKVPMQGTSDGHNILQSRLKNGYVIRYQHILFKGRALLLGNQEIIKTCLH